MSGQPVALVDTNTMLSHPADNTSVIGVFKNVRYACQLPLSYLVSFSQMLQDRRKHFSNAVFIEQVADEFAVIFGEIRGHCSIFLGSLRPCDRRHLSTLNELLNQAEVTKSFMRERNVVFEPEPQEYCTKVFDFLVSSGVKKKKASDFRNCRYVRKTNFTDERLVASALALAHEQDVMVFTNDSDINLLLSNFYRAERANHGIGIPNHPVSVVSDKGYNFEMTYPETGQNSIASVREVASLLGNGAFIRQT